VQGGKDTKEKASLISYWPKNRKQQDHLKLPTLRTACALDEEQANCQVSPIK